MVKESTEVNRQSDEQIDDTGRGTGTGRNSESTDSTSTSTSTRGRGRGRGTGTDTGTGTAEEKDVLTVVAVDDTEEQKRQERNQKRRERYQKQKESGTVPKPRKVNKKKKEEVADNTQLNVLIMTVSSIIASRPNCQHWLLSEQEINSITTPLSKMMAESEYSEMVGQYSNQIALVVACMTIFVPRIMISVQLSKQRKEVKNNGGNIKQFKQPDNETGKSVESSGGDKSDATSTDKVNVNDLSFLGAPISQ